jgi:hypothetical protein
MTLRFGPATVEVQAEQCFADVLEALSDWLEYAPDDEVAAPDVSVVLSQGRAAGRVGRARAWSTAQGSGWWDGKAWDAVLLREGAGGVLRWVLSLHESRALWATRVVPNAVIGWAHAHRFGRAQMLANAALYGHLLPAAQEALRLHNSTLVHASAVTGPSGDAVLILGRGGAGKTSASTQLYIRQPERWRYMSDDLAVLSADGILYRSPVPLNIFPYNTERFPELWDLLAAEMSPWDRLQWSLRRRILGAAATARRRPPFSSYLGPPTARIRQVVELERADILSPVAEAGDVRRVVREARNVLAHELARGFLGVASVRALAKQGVVPLPDPTTALDDAERVMERAFGLARLHRIQLPRFASPDAVGEIVERTIAAQD